MDIEEKDTDYLKFIEWSVNAHFENIPLSAEELRFEVRRRLTKKELKLLLHIYLNGDQNINEFVAKMNIDQERQDELIESGKRKIRNLASWQRKN